MVAWKSDYCGNTLITMSTLAAQIDVDNDNQWKEKKSIFKNIFIDWIYTKLP